MPNCCIVRCRNGHIAKASKAHEELNPNVIRYFRTPKEENLLVLWSQRIITKKVFELGPSSRICEEHFFDQDRIKHDKIIIGGNKIINPRTNWKLKNGAIPSIFEDIYSSLQHLPATGKVIPE
ncbi:Uncharacterized protein APZ42_012025 [Daphnia magna]|uniref:THAP-type domain-containing protein n=1 Tax=Daphnia magna TaxID=35525 RepID=A0A162SAC8_9CRUS|nr:Uncharacterized protein APZ42_012025 [Daphnia magna]